VLVGDYYLATSICTSKRSPQIGQEPLPTTIGISHYHSPCKRKYSVVSTISTTDNRVPPRKVFKNLASMHKIDLYPPINPFFQPIKAYKNL